MNKAGATLVALAFVATCAGAVLAITESAEERSAAVAALDVHLATMHIDESLAALARVSGDAESEHLAHLAHERSVVLTGTDEAIHALPAEQREIARTELRAVADNAQSVLDGKTQPAVSDTHEHHHVQELLASATSKAQDKADATMKAAGVLGALALISLGGLLWISFASRSRTRFQYRLYESEQLRHQQLEALLDSTPDAILAVDDDGRVVYSSQAADDLLNVSEAAALRDLFDRVTPDQRAAFARHISDAIDPSPHQTFRLDTACGEAVDFQLRVVALEDTKLPLKVVSLRDVSSELKYKAELKRQARIDVLTGLPNRRMLEPTVEQAQRQAAGAQQPGGQGCPHTLAMVDLDSFKEINDRLGHAVGDKVLTVAARRLASTVGDRGTVLRLGGDEFAIVFPQTCSLDRLNGFASEIVDSIGQPMTVAGRQESVKASLGFAMSNDRLSAEELLRRADLALYEAKRSGGASWRLFDESMAARSDEASAISRALRDSTNNEFHLVFQPIVRADTAEVEFYEALLRWDCPELGPVGPDQFIPIAEATGAIVQLGDWVIHEAVRQLRTWIDLGFARDTSVSVNVSTVQLAESDFSDRVLAILEQWRVAPQSLIIEITESGLVGQTGLPLDHLHRLREAGCKVAIDDFGSGYSNLGQMLGLPLDLIKVDRLLLDQLTGMRTQMGGDPAQPCTIMEAVVQIATTLGAPVVAEGVEDSDQRESLYRSGVSLLQGFAFSRPVSPDEIVAMAGVPTAAAVTYDLGSASV